MVLISHYSSLSLQLVICHRIRSYNEFPTKAGLAEVTLLTRGSFRLGRILYLTGFVVRLASMSCMLSLGLIVELGDGHMLQPITFLTFRAVHGHIAGRRRIGAMKMVKTCFPTIGLRFGTKCALDALTDEQQFCRGVAHGFIEHQELHAAIAFVQP